MNKIYLILLALLGVNSYADTVTATMTSSARVNASCTLSTTSITFGEYFPNGGDSFASGNLAVLCTNGTSMQLGINYSGLEANNQSNDKYAFSEGGKTYARYMSNGTEKLRYNLFQDSAYTKVFGGSNWFTLTSNARPTLVGNGLVQNVPVYAVMSAGQYVKAGSYIDSTVAYIIF